MFGTGAWGYELGTGAAGGSFDLDALLGSGTHVVGGRVDRFIADGGLVSSPLQIILSSHQSQEHAHAPFLSSNAASASYASLN